MIESDNLWHHKTFESVMSDLQNMWTEGIRKLENAHMHCSNNDEINNEMDGVMTICFLREKKVQSKKVRTN